jgi:outer membrane protein TolC
MTPFILHLVFSLVSTPAAHGQALSLQQALDMAGKNSPEVQRAEAAQEEAHWRKVESYSTYMPTINAQADHLLDKKYVFLDLNFLGNPVSFPNIMPTTTYSLEAEWSLFDGFAGTDRVRAARSLESAATEESQWAAFKVLREVTLQYYRALAAKTLQTVSENNLATLKDHLKDVNALRHSGLSTNYDVLRVEVQVDEAESELLNAQDNTQLSKSKLAETLGSDSAVDTQGQLPELKADLTAKLQPQPAARPDLQALAQRVQGLDYMERADSRHWVPQLLVYGDYLYYNNRNDQYDDWDNFRNAYSLGVRLRWNLFDGFKDTARDHQALAQKVQSEKTLRAQQLKAKQDVEVWTRKFKYFSSVYKTRQSDIGKAKEAVRLAREGRKAGARTNTDLLDAEADLYRAQAGAINAQLGAIEALINVELATGQPLYNFN